MDIYGLLKTTDAYRSYKRDAESGRTAHANLIYCRDKLTADNILRLFAAGIMCVNEDSPCLNCVNCSRILKDTHPDCRFYPVKNDKILVEDIDGLTEEAGYRPCEGDKKVFLLSNCETMNAASQNKLLKTLEEPNGSVYIIMAAANPESLLPTVKSRCRTAEIPPFKEEAVSAFLKENGCNDKKAAAVSRICGGNLGKALEMTANDSYTDMYNFIYGLFGKLNSYDDVLPCIKVINAYEDKNAVLDIMQVYFRDNMLKAEQGGGKSGGYGAKSLIYFIEKTLEAKRKLSLNCSKAAVFETLLNEIVSAKEGQF